MRARRSGTIPQTWARFVWHVTGEEYARFRDVGALGAGARGLWRGWIAEMFLGAPLLTLIGAGVVARRRWRWALVLGAALAPLVIYT